MKLILTIATAIALVTSQPIAAQELEFERRHVVRNDADRNIIRDFGYMAGYRNALTARCGEPNRLQQVSNVAVIYADDPDETLSGVMREAVLSGISDVDAMTEPDCSAMNLGSVAAQTQLVLNNFNHWWIGYLADPMPLDQGAAQ